MNRSERLRYEMLLRVRDFGSSHGEITATCDAACIYCHRHDMDRPQKAMEFGLFKRLIDEAAILEIPTLALNGFGETLTIPNWETTSDTFGARRIGSRVFSTRMATE